MKVRINSMNLRAICAGAAVAAAGSAALAQSAGGSFERPLRSTTVQPSAGQGRSTVMMSQSDGNDTYEVQVVDGQISAKVNGKSVPQDRIVKEDGSVKILDKDGNVLTQFEVSVGGGGAAFGRGGQIDFRSRRLQPAQPTPPAPSKPVQPQAGEIKPLPKVMLGIYMNEPDEDVRDEHGLGGGEGIVIERVVPELSAARAGIREGDIIVEINGKKPATQEALREALKGKNPGDTVEFTVLREDGDRTIRVKLDKYDPDKLGVGMAPGAAWQGMEGGRFEALNQDKLREELQNRFKGYSNLWIPDGQGGVVLGGPGAAAFQGEARQRLDARMQELDRKIEELDRKMARLDELIARLEKSIEKTPRSGRD